MPTVKEMQDKLKELYPEIEPVFILRAQDELSAVTIDFYLQRTIKRGCTVEFQDKVCTRLQEFMDWQEQYVEKTKLPD